MREALVRIEIQLQIKRRSDGPRRSDDFTEVFIELRSGKNLHDIARQLRHIVLPLLAQIPAGELVLPRMILELGYRALVDGLNLRAQVILFEERGHGVEQSRIGRVAVDLAAI